MAEDSETGVLRQLADELKLQAWLAAAEFRHPSLAHDDTRKEVDALARWRDEFRVQFHLGKLQMREDWHALEGRWQRVKSLATQTADDLEGSMQDTLRELRDGYAKIRKA